MERVSDSSDANCSGSALDNAFYSSGALQADDVGAIQAKLAAARSAIDAVEKRKGKRGSADAQKQLDHTKKELLEAVFEVAQRLQPSSRVIDEAGRTTLSTAARRLIRGLQRKLDQDFNPQTAKDIASCVRDVVQQLQNEDPSKIYAPDGYWKPEEEQPMTIEQYVRDVEAKFPLSAHLPNRTAHGGKETDGVDIQAGDATAVQFVPYQLSIIGGEDGGDGDDVEPAGNGRREERNSMDDEISSEDQSVEY